MSDGSTLSRTPFGVLTVQTSYLAGRDVVRYFLSRYRQAILERTHITPSGTEDFVSSRPHSDNLSLWKMFQLFPFNSLGGRPRAACRGVGRCLKKKIENYSNKKRAGKEKKGKRNRGNLFNRIESILPDCLFV